MSEEKNIPPEEILENDLVNKVPTDENISFTEPIAEVEQPKTTNADASDRHQDPRRLDYKPETENMEVHHHNPRKSWKPACRTGREKLEILFLGIFNVVPGGVLRIFG